MGCSSEASMKSGQNSTTEKSVDCPHAPSAFESAVRLSQDRLNDVLESDAVRVSERHHMLQVLLCQQKKQSRVSGPYVHPIALFSKFPPLFSPQTFQHFPPHGILELHLRVIRCNTCSSIIVSPHHPENV